MGVARAGNLETVGQSNAQVIDGSLKFDGVSQYLTRSFGSGNRRTWTWAAWVKRYKFGATNYGLFSYYPGSGNGSFIRFSDDDSGDTLRFYSDTNTRSIVSKEKFRDTGWYHIVISVDTAQGTDTDRVKRYVNGVQQTTNASNTWPSASEELLLNQSGDHFLGRVQASAYGPVAMSQVHFIDGLALGPGYFGFTDPLTNTWRPKKFRAQGTTVNDGTQWSSLVDVSNATVGSGSAANLFDGDLTTKINISAGYVEIDLSSRNVQAGPEGIEVYNNEGGAYTSYQVNGGEVINWQASAGWMSMGGANSKINTIRINYLSGGGVNAAFAFRVNGVIMIDSTTQNLAYGTNGFYLPMDGNTPIGQDQSGKGNNWTPVNFGGSNTLEKATGALPILNTDGGGKVARVGVRTDSAVGTGATCVLALPLVGTRKDYSNQINSGSTEKVLSIEETPSASSAQSNFYGGSYYFDGNRDHIYDPNSNVADYYLNGVNWTVECWVYPTDVSGTRVIMENTSSGSGGWSIQINSGEVEVQLASLFDPTPSNAIIANKWTHIAVVRSGSTTTLYLDGISRGTTATDAGTTSNTSLWIGSRSGGSYSYIGYMSDIRVYKGTAKYTQNFIPASTDPDILPDTPSGVSGSSKLTQITDGAVNFTADAGYTGGDWLTAQDNSLKLYANTGTWTIEAFVYQISTDSYHGIISNRPNGGGGLSITMENTGNLGFYASGQYNISNVLPPKQWNHVAMTKSGSSIYCFLNGRLLDTLTAPVSDNGDDLGKWTIGSYYTDGAYTRKCAISNVRIINGTALYTENFTPPTTALQSTGSETKLLCCQSNTSVTAANVFASTITSNGVPQATNFNPFTANINAVRGQESGWCTLNPLWKNSNSANNGGTYANGNLQHTTTGSNGNTPACASVYVSSGKWYWEAELISGLYLNIGVASDIFSSDAYPGYGTGAVNGQVSWGYISHTGNKIHNSTSPSSYGSTFAIGDIIGVAMDLTTGELTYYKNGVSQGVAFSNLSGNLTAAHADAGAAAGIRYNFGQKPFKFPPPAGFQPLALANTPRPTIVRPDQYVGVTTYTGNGSTASLNIGWKPDFVWFKSRSGANSHKLYDSVRGVYKALYSNGTATEANDSPYGVTSFNNNGVSINDNSNGDYGVNGPPGGTYSGALGTYVAWAWKAGGNSNTFNVDDVGYASASAAGLDAGTITPTGASVNTKSGFSIITYTAPSNTNTSWSVSHGLLSAPNFIIHKQRGPSTSGWNVYHSSVGAGSYGGLNNTSAFQSNQNMWNNTTPTSSVINLGGSSGSSFFDANNTQIIYAWTEIPGFSKFGSYTGNGSADGPMIVTGFRPRFLLLKATNTSVNKDWWILDSERNKYNTTTLGLRPNLSVAEGADDFCDFLSNGFKIRDTPIDINESGKTYIYAAFAESPSFNLYGAQSNAR